MVGRVLHRLGLSRLEDCRRRSGLLVGLPLGVGPEVVGLPLGLGPQLGDLPLGRGPAAADLALEAQPLLGVPAVQRFS